MKVGQLQRKRNEGSAKGRWTVMDVLRESWEVFRMDSMQQPGSLERGEPVERESTCGSLTVRELQSRDVEGASNDSDGSLAPHFSVMRA